MFPFLGFFVTAKVRKKQALTRLAVAAADAAVAQQRATEREAAAQRDAARKAIDEEIGHVRIAISRMDEDNDEPVEPVPRTLTNRVISQTGEIIDSPYFRRMAEDSL